MTLEQRLKSLRRMEAGCRLAAFGDLNSGIVLRSSSSEHCPQEHFDELCRQARQGFSMLDAAQADEDFLEGKGPRNDMLLLVPGEARVFIRSNDGSGDALLCACKNSGAARRLIGPGEKLLLQLAERAE